MTTILWKRGTTAKNDEYTGVQGEITIDTDSNHVRVHDGSTKGGNVLLNKDDIKTKTSQLSNDIKGLPKSSKINISTLTDDVGIWKSSELTKVSQLTNDVGYKTGYCSYCSYCTSNCTGSYNCNQISTELSLNCGTSQCYAYNCTQLQCTTVQCNYHSYDAYDSNKSNYYSND